jgi:hypothetical protein
MATDGHAAMLAPYNCGDPSAVARALDQLIASPDIRRRLIATGRFSVGRFAIDRLVASLLDAYHDPLSRPSRQCATQSRTTIDAGVTPVQARPRFRCSVYVYGNAP